MRNKLMVIILTILICTSCTYNNVLGNAVKEGEIKIGAILHLTGDQAETAQAFLEGIQLAVDEINQNGGVKNQKIKIIFEDDQLNPKKAYTSAVKLVSFDNVDALILASYLEGMAVGPYLEENKVPSIVLWDSAKDLEDIGEYLFGIGIWTPSAGEKAAEFAYNKLGLKKMAVINNLNEWSVAVSGFFKEKFEALGGKVIIEQSVDPADSADYKTVLTKVKKSNIDGIYSPITDGVPQFYKQYALLEIGKPIISSDIITENHIQILGEMAEGIYQTQANNPSEEKTQHLFKVYTDKYGKEPKQLLFVSLGYDSIYLIKEAIETDQDIKQGIYAIKNFDGASGKISIDEKGSSRKRESMFQIKDGDFVLIAN